MTGSPVCTLHLRLRYPGRPAKIISPLERRVQCAEGLGHGSGGVETSCRRKARYLVDRAPDPDAG